MNRNLFSEAFPAEKSASLSEAACVLLALGLVSRFLSWPEAATVTLGSLGIVAAGIDCLTGDLGEIELFRIASSGLAALTLMSYANII